MDGLSMAEDRVSMLDDDVHKFSKNGVTKRNLRARRSSAPSKAGMVAHSWMRRWTPMSKPKKQVAAIAIVASRDKVHQVVYVRSTCNKLNEGSFIRTIG